MFCCFVYNMITDGNITSLLHCWDFYHVVLISHLCNFVVCNHPLSLELVNWGQQVSKGLFWVSDWNMSAVTWMDTDIYRVVDCPTNHSNFLLPRTVTGFPNEKYGITIEINAILSNPQTEKIRSFQEWKQG